MFCTHCGNQVTSYARFCSQCGAAQNPAAIPVAARRLVRPCYGRKIAGVCLGFAHYLDLDVTLLRILWLVLTFFSAGVTVIGYVVAWILMPQETRVLAPPQAAAPAPEPHQ
jgi:phage shock protein PspC (stress-responsive transcriptional regulator)